MDPRTFWQLYEPFHAVTYFAPECHAAYEDAGVRGFWRGYFAGRAAPFGRAGAGLVTASFFGFHPDFVARAVPSVWDLIDPSAAIEARLGGVDAAIRARFDEMTPLAQTLDAARRAVDGCSAPGRPLFAANADLAWPSDPHLALWHATTLLREHRGDGHVIALVHAQLDPCEAHITQVASSGAGLDTIRPYRGWSDDDWDAGAERLRSRGLIDADGGLTPAGRELRATVESETDRLASRPLARLGPRDVELFERVMRGVAERLRETGAIRYPNPIGLAAPAH